MMMLVKKTIAAGLMGLSALAAVPATASADGFSFGFGIGDGGPRMHHWGPGRPFHGDDRPGFGRRGCNEWQAVETARDYGFRHPRVVRADPRAVVVEGRQRGGWARIVFANVRGCPVVYR